MPLIHDATRLKKKLYNPARSLRTNHQLPKEIRIQAESITSITQMAKHLLIVNCPSPVYISTALSHGSGELLECVSHGGLLRLRRCYNMIYYDVVLDF